MTLRSCRGSCARRACGDFCRHCYKKPLLLEWEEQGKAVDMCDREIRMVPCVEGDEEVAGEKLRVRRADKNADWVRGMAPGPKRIRFQPPLGHVVTGQMAQWIHGRWCDEVRKNAQDEQAQDVTVLGCLRLLVVFLLMGYKGAFVRTAVRKVRGVELRWMANIGSKWLRRFSRGKVEGERVQKELWTLQKELRIWD